QQAESAAGGPTPTSASARADGSADSQRTRVGSMVSSFLQSPLSPRGRGEEHGQPQAARPFTIIPGACPSREISCHPGGVESKGKVMGLLRRTHTCGELRLADIGNSVVLNGWVNSYRAYPDQVF